MMLLLRCVSAGGEWKDDIFTTGNLNKRKQKIVYTFLYTMENRYNAVQYVMVLHVTQHGPQQN